MNKFHASKKDPFYKCLFFLIIMLVKCFHRWYSPSIFCVCIFPVCWHNRHHSSWPFLECRPSKLYFKNLNTLKIWWLIIQIPPFSRKWPILPGKYMQVLSISSDWERQGPWAVWYIQFCNSVDVIFTKTTLKWPIECCDDGAAMAHNHFLFPDHCISHKMAEYFAFPLLL